MSTFDRYHRAIYFLEAFANMPLEKDYKYRRDNPILYIKRMRYFLRLINEPDRDLKFIHVTGTAGKGTVTAMMHAILHNAGKRVGSFSSPSITTSIEKIKVGERYIAPNDLADIVEYLKPYIDIAHFEGPYGRPSYFELFLAVALIYFQRQRCEWVVLEAGLGGRYDATNVIEKPIITAITNIDYDHMEVLGNTLQKIAYDKAGIIKKGSVFLTTEQRPSLIRIFQDICDEKKVPLHQILPQENYMKYNEALATGIAHHLHIDDQYILQGIENTRLPCRFEVMQRSPLVILDGAHNRAKIQSTLYNLTQLRFDKLRLVIGMADNKAKSWVLSALMPMPEHISFTRFQSRDRHCADPKELLTLSKKYLRRGVGADIFLDPFQALSSSMKAARKNDLVLVAGSFFLAGEMRKQWISEEYILGHRKSF